MKSKDQGKNEPFFITEDVAAELTAAGYEFVPPGHARTASIRDLFGWQTGETLSEAVNRHLEKADTDSGREPRGEGV
ncbi:transcriptional regulator [Pseudomonas aeruginosa]|uniref:transcriptional regulator n=1 Tax=Pseudomonas aeruginosa TaxID=287 RepID=UPI0021F1E18D|nr:transcriptional regulator [Pseudomonas aeruginosa]MCV4172404.1 transcriptional regulator [Pseudomonas aeruginosa]